MMKNNHILPFLWLHGEDEATLRDMLQDGEKEKKNP